MTSIYRSVTERRRLSIVLLTSLLSLALAATPVIAVDYTITVRTDYPTYTGVSTVRITGQVSPAPGPNTAAFVSVLNPNGDPVDYGVEPVDPNTGAFSHTTVTGGAGPLAASWISGTYTVNASWGSSGTVLYQTTTFQYTAGTTSTTTTLSLSQTRITLGQSVTITVNVNPSSATGSVVIQASRTGAGTSPQGYGWTEVGTGSVSSGTFTLQYTPTISDSYLVRANYTGSSNYSPSASAAVSFKVDFAKQTFVARADNRNFPVSVTSNSTVTNFVFDQAGKSISFTISGPAVTRGSSSVTFQNVLLNGTFSVTLGNTPVEYTLSKNSTHTTILTKYQHSPATLRISATVAIPEFTPQALLIVSLVALAVIAVFGRSRLNSGSVLRT